MLTTEELIDAYVSDVALELRALLRDELADSAEPLQRLQASAVRPRSPLAMAGPSS